MVKTHETNLMLEFRKFFQDNNIKEITCWEKDQENSPELGLTIEHKGDGSKSEVIRGDVNLAKEKKIKDYCQKNNKKMLSWEEINGKINEKSSANLKLLENRNEPKNYTNWIVGGSIILTTVFIFYLWWRRKKQVNK